MKLYLYQDDNLIKELKVSSYIDNTYEIIDDDTKMKIVLKPTIIITRDNKEAHFELNLTNNTCIYQLLEYNVSYDIELLMKNVINNEDKIIIEYKLNTQDVLNKIIIEKEEK